MKKALLSSFFRKIKISLPLLKVEQELHINTMSKNQYKISILYFKALYFGILLEGQIHYKDHIELLHTFTQFPDYAVGMCQN